MLKKSHVCCLALVVYAGPIYQVNAQTAQQLLADYESQCQEKSFISSVFNFNRDPKMAPQTDRCRHLLSVIQYKKYASADKTYYDKAMPLRDAEFRVENQSLSEVTEKQLGGYLLNDESLMFFETKGRTEPANSSTASNTKDPFGNFIIRN